jgi:hypothetical protein
MLLTTIMPIKAIVISHIVLAFFASALVGCAVVPSTPTRPDGPGVALLKADIAAGVTSGPPTFAPSQFAIKPKEIESPDEQLVRARAQKRWDLLVKSDIDLAYDYLSPSSKIILPKDEYKGRIRPGFWTSAQVVRVECEQENRCLVQTNVRVKMVVRQGGTINHESAVKEDWVNVSGQWWFVPAAQ